MTFLTKSQDDVDEAFCQMRIIRAQLDISTSFVQDSHQPKFSTPL